MHLEHDVGPCLQQLRCTMDAIILRPLTGHVASFNAVASRGSGCWYAASISTGSGSERAPVVVTRTVRPHGFVVDNIGCVWLEEHADVMRYRRFAGPNFHGRDPCIFRDAARDRDVRPFDDVV